MLGQFSLYVQLPSSFIANYDDDESAAMINSVDPKFLKVGLESESHLVVI